MKTIELDLPHIYRMALRGVPLAHQAAELNVHRSTISNQLKRAGYPPLPLGRPRKSRARMVEIRGEPVRQYLDAFDRRLLAPDERRSDRMNTMLDQLARLLT